MNYLKLRLITTGSLGSLEKVLHSTSGNEVKISHFSAERNTQRGHYEVEICISGFHSQDQVVLGLAGEEDIRELTPLRR